MGRKILFFSFCCFFSDIQGLVIAPYILRGSQASHLPAIQAHVARARRATRSEAPGLPSCFLTSAIC
jgi:hypothetical protein